jgi:hypothetical protein
MNCDKCRGGDQEFDDPIVSRFFRWLQKIGCHDKIVCKYDSTVFELTALTGDFSPLVKWSAESKRAASLTVAELALKAAEMGIVRLVVHRQHDSQIAFGIVIYSLHTLDDEVPF